MNSPNVILAIDTAGPQCGVCLYDGNTKKILADKSGEIGRGHGEILIEQINEALGEARLDYDKLDRIAVTTGPGSFTGIRVGLATARGLALALKIPICGFSSLETLISFSFETEKPDSPQGALLDARRNELYCQFNFDHELARAHTPFVCSIKQLAEAKTVWQAKPLLCGNGIDTLEAALSGKSLFDKSRNNILLTESTIINRLAYAPVQAVARLGVQQCLQQSSDPASNPAQLKSSVEPLYLRPPDAKPQKQHMIINAAEK